ncbi:MAG: thioredoxin [Bacilli bacterium]|nr:thioredoxin [Bacilli bacterium]MDD4298300.1 thioredoxin [Bacilli bacterium]
MSVINFEGSNYDEVIKDGMVVVDFYAEWCGPCKMLAPALEALSNARPDIKVVKVNVDKQASLASRFGIYGVPTLFLYKDGQVISKTSGFHTLDMLNEWIDNSIK